MPPAWYSIRENSIKPEDDEQTRKTKEFNMKIVAAVKPYFMIYVYPALKKKYDDYIKNNNLSAAIRFSKYNIHSIEDLQNYSPKTAAMSKFLECYDKYMPVGTNKCLVNRICWLFENEFAGYSMDKPEFDYTILKSDVEYSRASYNEILEIYHRYLDHMDAFQRRAKIERIDSDSAALERERLFEVFKMECECVCPNEDELCDIVLDICYHTERSKQFAWDVSGDVMLRNLMRRHNNIVSFPKMVEEDGEFEYGGKQFVMCEKVVTENDRTE